MQHLDLFRGIDPHRCCLTCRHWSNDTPTATDHIWCMLHKLVIGVPDGCGCYEREPGSDDEPPPPRNPNSLVLQRIAAAVAGAS
jgi:hypothetical protein